MSERFNSRFFKFGSLTLNFGIFFVLKILTKFSACLTDNRFSIIFFAKKEAFSKPTNIFACPCDNLLFLIKSTTSIGKFSNLKQFATWLLLLPINCATLF